MFCGLGPGSVVELEQMEGEPVDILINQTLIAKGPRGSGKRKIRHSHQ